MNRKTSKNVQNQQNRGKPPRPVSRGSSGVQKKTKRSFLSPESGINFLVNVSSSGTNLNKKIEQQMAKIEIVEKKIRNFKSKCPARIPTAATNNQKKLRNVLENMLAAIDSEPKKSRRQQKMLKKTDNDSSRKLTKPKKYMIREVVCESLTSFVNKNKRNCPPKLDVPKEGTSCKKPVLKKPFSTPTEHYKSLREDLKFAEKLNFGKNVDLGLELAKMKNTLQNSIPIQHANDHNNSNNCDVNPEKSPKNTLTYVYDSTSKFTTSALPKPQNNSNATVKKKKNEKKQNNFDEITETEPKPEPIKVVRKKIYSTLARGNFTISHHSDVLCDSDGKDEDEEDAKFGIIEEAEETNEDTGKGDNNNSRDKRNEQNIDTDGIGTDAETFPMDLLERSILAVESVLRTINSMTNEFGSEEIKNPYSEDDPMQERIAGDSLEAFTTTSIDNLGVNMEEFAKKSASESSLASREVPKTRFEKSLQTIESRKASRSDTNLHHQSKIIAKSGRPHKQFRGALESEGNSRRVIYLKPPIKIFQESEENFILNQQQSSNLILEHVSHVHQMEMEPLKMALNALRSRISAIRHVMDVEPQQNETSHHKNQHSTEKPSTNDEIFTENSSVTSYTMSHHHWSSDESAKTNHKYPFSPKRGIKKWSNYKNQTTQKIFKKKSELKVFPEYNFERCLTLLSRKFKDFEMTRRGKFKKIIGTDKNQSREGEGICKRETYDNCSLDSNKVGDFGNNNNFYNFSRTNSSPE